MTVSVAVMAIGLEATAAPPRREITLAANPGEFKGLVQALAPGARLAAVSEVARRLIVGYAPQTTPQVSLFALDKQGALIDSPPVSLTLPLPMSLTKRTNHPLALAAHPRLPLLYVWQDVQAPHPGEPDDDLERDGFCHLLIYDLASNPPQLIDSLATGASYQRANWAGAMGLDAGATRLFVPNLRRETAKGAIVPAIGFLKLNEHGLPASNDPREQVEAAVAVGKVKSTEQAQLAWAARRKYLQDVREGKLLDRATRNATDASATFAGWPCGLAFFPVSESVTIVGGPLGPVTWDESNRRAQFLSLNFFPLAGVGYQYRLAGNHELPVVYLTGLSTNWIYCVEHADGFLTLAPQRGALPAVTILSPPVVLSKRKQVACASLNMVHLLSLDEQGFFSGERSDLRVVALGHVLAYSAEFDKLYVPVEKVSP